MSEGAGSVSAIVSVLSGTLARDVSVKVFTSDSTATSEGGCDLLLINIQKKFFKVFESRQHLSAHKIYSHYE